MAPDAGTFYSNYHHLALCVSGDVGYDGCVSSCIVHCVMCIYDTEQVYTKQLPLKFVTCEVQRRPIQP
jgi:hypothetical protein